MHGTFELQFTWRYDFIHEIEIECVATCSLRMMDLYFMNVTMYACMYVRKRFWWFISIMLSMS